MITADELMIGNYVTREGILHEVTISTFAMMGGGFYWANNLQPIPITEEWLLKLGFELSKVRFNLCPLYIKEKYRIQVTKDFFIDVDNSEKILYVHELQNIYYWRTKQKLTIQ